MGGGLSIASDGYIAPQGNGKIKTVVPDKVWAVGAYQKLTIPLAPSISRTSLIVRAPNGELTMVNSIRLDAEGEAELNKLGKLTSVVRTSNEHTTDDAYYASKGVKFYAPAPVSKGGEPNSRWPKEQQGSVICTEYTETSPPPCLPECKICIFYAPNKKHLEALILLVPYKLLTCSDFIQVESDFSHHEGYQNAWIFRKMGFDGDMITPPMFFMVTGASADNKASLYATNKTVMGWDWENFVGGHGAPIMGKAKTMRAEWCKANNWPL